MTTGTEPVFIWVIIQRILPHLEDETIEIIINSVNWSKNFKHSKSTKSSIMQIWWSTVSLGAGNQFATYFEAI